MRPSVQINALNLHQGVAREVERTALFVGLGTQNLNQVFSLSADSDFDALFGKDETELKKQVKTAMLNAGQNWFAYAYAMSNEDYDFEQAVRKANETAKFEYAVNTHTVGVDKAALNGLQSLYAEFVAKLGRRIFFIQAIDGCSETESWQQYLEKCGRLTKGVVAEHCMLVPNLFGNDVGALAGRLANRAVTVADTPARVKTGALVGLGRTENPTDKDGVLLDLSHIEALDRSRLSTVTYYPDYDGYYWGDGVTLEAEGGDYHAVEYLRVVDKACRLVRLKAIEKIGDRALNSTNTSIELHKTLFAGVLREMSKTVEINNEVFYGECYPPTDESIEIVWENKNTVKIYITVQPVECPKAITVSVMLDLSVKGDKE